MEWIQLALDAIRSIKFKKKVSILIIEDTITDADLLRRYIENAGRKADVVNSAEEGKGALLNKKYSIVFIDIRLPLMDGIALIKYISDNNPDVKNVIIVGEVGDLVNLPKGLFTSIIIKPVNSISVNLALNVLG